MNKLASPKLVFLINLDSDWTVDRPWTTRGTHIMERGKYILAHGKTIVARGQGCLRLPPKHTNFPSPRFGSQAVKTVKDQSAFWKIVGASLTMHMKRIIEALKIIRCDMFVLQCSAFNLYSYFELDLVVHCQPCPDFSKPPRSGLRRSMQPLLPRWSPWNRSRIPGVTRSRINLGPRQVLNV